MTTTENWILISKEIKAREDTSYSRRMAIFILDSLIQTGEVDTEKCDTYMKIIYLKIFGMVFNQVQLY